MNKSELIESVADASGVDKRQAESVLTAFFDTVQSEASGGSKVGWPGFGSFTTTRSNARMGRNPRDGSPVKIAAKTRMKFSESSTLKDALNAKGAKKAGGRKAAKKTAPAKKAAAKKTTAARKAPAKKKAVAKKTTAKKTTRR